MEQQTINIKILYDGPENVHFEISPKNLSTYEMDNVDDFIKLQPASGQLSAIRCETCKEKIHVNLLWIDLALNGDFDNKITKMDDPYDTNTIVIVDQVEGHKNKTVKPELLDDEDIYLSKEFKHEEGMDYVMELDDKLSETNRAKIFVEKLNNDDFEEKSTDNEDEEVEFNTSSLDCELCGRKTSSVPVLMNHRVKHFFQLESDKSCLACNKQCLNPDKQMSHSYCCLEKDKINVKACRYCSHISTSVIGLGKHINRMHKNKNDTTVSTVTEPIPEKKNTKKAIKIDEKDKEFKCDNCEKAFLTHTSLQIHTTKVHFRREVKYSCHLCGKLFISRSNHNLHMNEKHAVYCEPVNEGRLIHY